MTDNLDMISFIEANFWRTDLHYVTWQHPAVCGGCPPPTLNRKFPLHSLKGFFVQSWRSPRRLQTSTHWPVLSAAPSLLSSPCWGVLHSESPFVTPDRSTATPQLSVSSDPTLLWTCLQTQHNVLLARIRRRHLTVILWFIQMNERWFKSEGNTCIRINE